MTTTMRERSSFCSVCAREAGLDPAGQASAYDQIVAAEIPLPWPITMYDQPGVLPDEFLRLRQLMLEEYRQGRPIRMQALAIAPDPSYSQPGLRRALFYQRPETPFAAFARREYLLPEAELGPLCWALLAEPAALPRFERYRQPDADVRDLLVCTHGNVDAACARFGIPTYQQLRRIADKSGGRLRAWRTSHFGGHVFAPTLIDLPHGSYWAYIEAEQARLLAQHGDVARLRAHYRGWSGLESPFLQALERELFVQRGWPWREYLKIGRVLAHDQRGSEQPGWAEVQLSYGAPDGSERGLYRARVEVARQVVTQHSTGAPDACPYPQYAVSELIHTPA